MVGAYENGWSWDAWSSLTNVASAINMLKWNTVRVGLVALTLQLTLLLWSKVQGMAATTEEEKSQD